MATKAKIVTIQEAEHHLSDLIALVDKGEEVIIAKDNQPMARLVAVRKTGKKRVFGAYRGKIRIAADFDAPLPNSYWLESGTA